MSDVVRVLVAMVAGLCGCAPASTSAPAASHRGCFIVVDLRTQHTQAWDEQACDVRTSPASTFKIPHALIGLEAGVIPNAASVRPWDEDKHGWAPWGREDQTLTTAIRESVVWFFQEVASEIGEDRMLDALQRLEYGDGEVGGKLTTFWLDGTLTISAQEQADFLRRFWSGRLPVAAPHVTTVGEILNQPVTALKARVGEPMRFDWAWRTAAKTAFKTGATAHEQGSVTWLVGRMQHADNDVVFVSRVISDGPVGAGSPAVEDALLTLLDLGLL